MPGVAGEDDAVDLTGRQHRPARPVSAPATEDFLPLLASICAVAAARSPSSSDRSSLEQEATPPAKVTAAEPNTARVTPTKEPEAVWA